MSKKDPDLKKIKELIKIMKDNDLVEVEIKHGEDKVFLKRSQPQLATGGSIAAVPAIVPSKNRDGCQSSFARPA